MGEEATEKTKCKSFLNAHIQFIWRRDKNLFDSFMREEPLKRSYQLRLSNATHSLQLSNLFASFPLISTANKPKKWQGSLFTPHRMSLLHPNIIFNLAPKQWTLRFKRMHDEGVTSSWRAKICLQIGMMDDLVLFLLFRWISLYRMLCIMA